MGRDRSRSRSPKRRRSKDRDRKRSRSRDRSRRENPFRKTEPEVKKEIKTEDDFDRRQDQARRRRNEQNYRGSHSNRDVKQERNESPRRGNANPFAEELRQTNEWGKAEDNAKMNKEVKEKEKPNLGLSGALTADANTYKVYLKFFKFFIFNRRVIFQYGHMSNIIIVFVVKIN